MRERFRGTEGGASLARFEASLGSCARCRHREWVRGRDRSYVRCAASRTDPRLARYPHLPTFDCHGFETGE